VPADKNGRYYNVINGHRVTTDIPEKYDNTIYTYGTCMASGIFAEDKYTIQSCLQRLLNESGKTYRVMNCGRRGGVRIDDFSMMLRQPLGEGDIMIFLAFCYGNCLEFFNEDNSGCTLFLDMAEAFHRPHEFGEVFFDYIHMTQKGYKLIAGMLFRFIRQLQFVKSERRTDPVDPMSFGAAQIHNPSRNGDIDSNGPHGEAGNKDLNTIQTELESYVAYITSEKADASGPIGAVVMNCNPFTLGHRHLIERALSECDFLYVFVVEEDKSEYTFKDRISLVKKGVSDLRNVKVIPSGKFIISSITLPEYFAKSEKITIDATRDIETFAKHIAPALGIEKRFVGDEPTCYITRQYNQAMKETLPRHGIKFVVFNRLESQGKPISASTVRQLVEEGNYEEVKTLVPESTYEFLVEQRNRGTAVLDI
jgi:[citrate (pro-3S)-lyase] ligase